MTTGVEYYGYVNGVDPEQGDEYVASIREKVQRVIGSAYTVTSIDWKMLKLGGRPTQTREGTLIWTATGPPYWHTWQATTIWVKEWGTALEKEIRIGGVTGGGALQLGRPKAPPADRQRKGKREREGQIPFPKGKVTKQMFLEWKAKNQALEAEGVEEKEEGEKQ